MIPRPLNLVRWDTLFQEPLSEGKEYLLIPRHGHVYLKKNFVNELRHDEVFYEVLIKGTEISLKEVKAYSNPQKREFRGVAGSIVRLGEDLAYIIAIAKENKELKCLKESSKVFRLHDKVLLLCTDRNNIKILSPSSNDLIELKNVITARGSWTQLIVGNMRGEALAFIIDPLRGLFREYKITNCAPDRAVCGDSLCLIKCDSEEYYAITFNNIHAIPAGISPLASCGNSEYYFDIENNLLTRYLSGILEPLVDVKPQCLACYDETDIVLSDQSGTYLLHGNTLFQLTELPSKEVTSNKPVVVIKAKTDRYVIANTSKRTLGEVYARSCAPTTEGPVVCIVDEGIALLSPFEFFNPQVRVLRDFVDYDGYAIVEIEPWSPGSTYDIKGPAIAVNTIASSSKAIVALRPRRLGWSGNVTISVKLPIYHISSNLHIASKEPSLSELSLSNCVFLRGGHLKKTNYNFRMILEAIVSSPVPEEPSLELSCNSLSNYSIQLLSKECTLSNSCNFTLEIAGYSKDASKIPFELILRYGRGDNYRIGKSIVDLSNYILENPLNTSRLIIKHLDNRQSIMRSVKGAKLFILCSNGRTFEGTENIIISECLEPLLVSEEFTDNNYVWHKEYLIKCDTRYAVNEGLTFNIVNAKKREGGILCRSTLITIPNNLQVDARIAGLRMHDNETVEITLRLKTNVPSLISIKCGDTLTKALVENDAISSIKCLIQDILNGLDIVAIPIGMSKISQQEVESKEAVRLLVQNAVRVAKTIFHATPGLSLFR